jgi:hypothetical protein
MQVSSGSRWLAVNGSEDYPLVATKNCTTENWRNISWTKRNNGECFSPVCRTKSIFVSSPDIPGQRNRIFFEKIVLIFIIHVVTILRVAVGIVAKLKKGKVVRELNL